MTSKPGDAQRRSVALGKAFERIVQTKLEGQRQIGLVRWFQHNQPGWRKVGREWMPVAASGADFAGHLMGGCAFGIEAKATENDRYAYNHIRELQVQHLDALATGGALALFALEFNDPQTFAGQPVHPPQRFLVSWRDFPWKVLRTARSVTATDLVGWEMPEIGDFLGRFVWRCRTCGCAWPFDRSRCTCGAVNRPPVDAR